MRKLPRGYLPLLNGQTLWRLVKEKIENDIVIKIGEEQAVFTAGKACYALQHLIERN